MKLYQIGQLVNHKGRKWIITGFGEDADGHTVYYLKRGCYRTIADEAEVSE